MLLHAEPNLTHKVAVNCTDHLSKVLVIHGGLQGQTQQVMGLCDAYNVCSSLYNHRQGLRILLFRCFNSTWRKVKVPE